MFDKVLYALTYVARNLALDKHLSNFHVVYLIFQ